LYRLWPEKQVFIDGQTDFYGEALSREYAQVTAEAESIVPFSNGKFNNASFNQMFVHMKELHEQQNGRDNVPGHPAPTVSREIEACAQLSSPSDSAAAAESAAADFKQAYHSHRNPAKYDKGFVAQFQGQPDITRVNALTPREAEQRIGA